MRSSEPAWTQATPFYCHFISAPFPSEYDTTLQDDEKLDGIGNVCSCHGSKGVTMAMNDSQ